MVLSSTLSALVLLMISGIFNGSSVVPLKYAHRSEWENLWLIQSIVAMIILPYVLLWLTIPQPMNVYRAAGFGSFATTAGFGFGWGVGTLLYIIGVVMVGMSVSFAIILSLTATLGSLFPLLLLHPQQVHTRQGHFLMMALGLAVVGITFCALAGENHLKENAGTLRTGAKRYFWWGVVVCVLSGIFSPMLNFAFAFGERIADIAHRFGASTLWAPNAIWAVAFSSAFALNALYCLWHLGWSKSLSRFLDAPWENVIGGSIMGVLLLASIVIYGIGADALGSWGASAGWAINMCATIFAANGWGLATGEWKNASRKSYTMLALGLGAITVAIIFSSPIS